jgi:dTDP-4-dehydrorhamnose reductase
MRIGQLARAYAELLKRGFSPRAFGRAGCDLEQRETSANVIRRDVLIDAAGHAALDKAGAEPDVAMRITPKRPKSLRDCRQGQASQFPNLWTDNVSCGDKLWLNVESELIGPAGAWDRSKLEGQLQVAAANPTQDPAQCPGACARRSQCRVRHVAPGQNACRTGRHS